MRKFPLIPGVALAASLAIAKAATTFHDGNLNGTAGWNNGLPGPGNDGAIAVRNSNH